MNGNIEYETGNAPVSPGPPATGRPWEEAGPPPYSTGPLGASAPAGRRGMPTWAIILIVAGVALVVLCCGITTVAAVLGDDENDPDQPPATVAVPSPSSPSVAEPPAHRHLEVEVSGECEKQIIGYYGLLSTVTVDNPTEQEVSGTVWVSWDVLGDDPYVFSEEITVAPGEAVNFHTDEEIESERWFRVEECEYGFTPPTD